MSKWEQEVLDRVPTLSPEMELFLNRKIDPAEEEFWLWFEKFQEEQRKPCHCKDVYFFEEEERVKKTIKVKTFMNGGSQAIRIPAECRFDDPEVYLTYDTETGTVSINKSGSAESIDELLDYFVANPLPQKLPHNFVKTLWPKDDFRDRLAEFGGMHNEVSN